MQRILVNLFRNARQAMEAVETGRKGLVTLRAERRDDHAVITIADNGPGVPERVRTTLFQPFTGSGRPDGTGLGLAIARELARGHGGELELQQAGPDGSSFLLTLPG